MQINSLDHLVLTVTNINITIDFYTRILGMQLIRFGTHQERVALQFGRQKINLHQAGKEIAPHAKQPIPGSADLCFLSTTPLLEIIQQLQNCGIKIELGPVPRTGANGVIESIYVRDPDNNLIEIANYKL